MNADAYMPNMLPVPPGVGVRTRREPREAREPPEQKRYMRRFKDLGFRYWWLIGTGKLNSKANGKCMDAGEL